MASVDHCPGPRKGGDNDRKKKKKGVENTKIHKPSSTSVNGYRVREPLYGMASISHCSGPSWEGTMTVEKKITFESLDRTEVNDQ